MGQTSYAQGLYQRIYQVDPAFQEVTLRLQEISKKATGPSMGVSMPGATQVQGQFRYQVVKEIGRGGMGVVYLAKDANLGRTVAYKVLPQEMKKHPDIVENFLREVKVLAQLNHPYIVSIFDGGEYQGNYFIVMELVEGEDLKVLGKRSRRVPPRIGMEIFKQLAQALDYAHSKKVIHRDIKPSNIMWTQNQIIKIMDFGLAKLLEEVKTGRTLVSGTPLYMSPEQTLGKSLDARTDIYSAGATMYELLCGQPPFSEGDIGYHHIHTPPRSPRELNPEIPDELNRIILKCLAKDPEQRYQNAREIYLDLKTLER
jgi:serine/threonine-protein kinase